MFRKWPNTNFINMNEFTLIRLEWNAWNGFVFSLVGIEAGEFEGELLGLHFSRDHFIFSVCFYQFTVASPFI